jgi:hypothetical protein
LDVDVVQIVLRHIDTEHASERRHLVPSADAEWVLLENTEPAAP